MTLANGANGTCKNLETDLSMFKNVGSSDYFRYTIFIFTLCYNFKHLEILTNTPLTFVCILYLIEGQFVLSDISTAGSDHIQTNQYLIAKRYDSQLIKNHRGLYTGEWERI